MNEFIVKYFFKIYDLIADAITLVYVIMVLPFVAYHGLKSRNIDATLKSFLSISLKLTNWLYYYEAKIGSILYSKNNLLKYFNRINKKLDITQTEFDSLNPFDTRNITSKGMLICGLKMKLLAIQDSGKLPQSVAKSDQDEKTEL